MEDEFLGKCLICKEWTVVSLINSDNYTYLQLQALAAQYEKDGVYCSNCDPNLNDLDEP